MGREKYQPSHSYQNCFVLAEMAAKSHLGYATETKSLLITFRLKF